MNDLINIAREAAFFIFKAALRFFNHLLEMIKEPQDNARQLVIAIGIILVTLSIAITSIFILWSGRKNSTEIPIDDGFPAEDSLRIGDGKGGERH